MQKYRRHIWWLIEVLGYYMEFDQEPNSCRRLLARGRSDLPLQLHLSARIIAH